METRFKLVLTVCVFYFFATGTVTAANITFLSKQQAREAIISETVQPYFSLLQAQEMSAKTGRRITGSDLAAMRQETRMRYQQAVMEFNDADKAVLKNLVDKLSPLLASSFPKLSATAWKFIKVKDSLEGSLPHTRDDYIVLSAGLLNKMKTSMQSSPQAARLNWSSLLVHELVHVFQRNNPGFFTSLYTDTWKFQQVSNIKGFENWRNKHQVVNPDAIHTNWIWPLRQTGKTRWVLPGIYLISNQPVASMPADLRSLVMYLNKTPAGFQIDSTDAGQPRATALTQTKGYTPFLYARSSSFHPNEIAAENIAMMFIVEQMVTRKDIPDKNKAKLLEINKANLAWYRKNFSRN